ncbi:hypothetical protein AJ88_21975 [Mesorhizobium amorphae CCBAU 01583]|nr:hypothetical protein AJ88_21975 [Mesorhizobium amorphae CCBAU 01583]
MKEVHGVADWHQIGIYAGCSARSTPFALGPPRATKAEVEELIGKQPKLLVVSAFHRDETCDLQPALG